MQIEEDAEEPAAKRGSEGHKQCHKNINYLQGSYHIASTPGTNTVN